jgi:hypothetical protein
VWLNSPNLPEPRALTTDLEGRYQFVGLPAGQYTLSASKNGFLALSYGQTHPSMPPRTLQLREREIAENINLLILKAGVISGRIVDEFGDAITTASVTLLRLQFQQGRPRLVAFGPDAVTNDLGEYRHFGLPQGSYYLSASLPPGPPRTENGVQLLGEDPAGLAPTFYPGTNDLATAAKVSVGPGETVMGVDVRLAGGRLANVSGMAMGRGGAAMTSGVVNAIPRGMAQNGFARSSSLGANGQFRVAGLPPGQYTLIASSRIEPITSRSANGPSHPDVATSVVSVVGDDIDGVFLAPLKLVTISGRVVLDRASTAATLAASAIRMVVTVPHSDGMAGLVPSPQPLKDDFQFAMQVPAVAIRVGATVLSGAGVLWSVKSVSVNGADVTDVGIDLGGGGDIAGIEIELTDRAPRISGTVTGANASVTGYSVIIFPQDSQKRTTGAPDLFRLAQADPDGKFSIMGLRGGSYYAAVLSEIDDLAWTDPSFLEGVKQRATAFSLAVGEHKSLVLSP